MNHLKHLFAATVIVADVVFGMALPESIKNMHHEKGAHLYGSAGVYVVLLLLTVWVITSVVQHRSASRQSAPSPAARPGYPASFRRPL